MSAYFQRCTEGRALIGYISSLQFQYRVVTRRIKRPLVDHLFFCFKVFRLKAIWVGDDLECCHFRCNFYWSKINFRYEKVFQKPTVPLVEGTTQPQFFECQCDTVSASQSDKYLLDMFVSSADRREDFIKRVYIKASHNVLCADVPMIIFDLLPRFVREADNQTLSEGQPSVYFFPFLIRLACRR